jgi:hypothetical protein
MINKKSIRRHSAIVLQSHQQRKFVTLFMAQFSQLATILHKLDEKLEVANSLLVLVGWNKLEILAICLFL